MKNTRYISGLVAALSFVYATAGYAAPTNTVEPWAKLSFKANKLFDIFFIQSFVDPKILLFYEQSNKLSENVEFLRSNCGRIGSYYIKYDKKNDVLFVNGTDNNSSQPTLIIQNPTLEKIISLIRNAPKCK